MTTGIDLTFQVLKGTKNQAAGDVLKTAFKSSDAGIRKYAAIALINRKGGSGLETIFADYDPNDQVLIDLLNDNRQKIIPGLRSAVVSDNKMIARNAYRYAFSQGIYEVLPVMFAYCFSAAGFNQSGIAAYQQNMLKFCDKFTEAMSNAEPHEKHLFFNVIFPDLVKTIRSKIKDFRNDNNELTLKVYLRFYPFYTDVESDLKQILKLTSTPVYMAVYRRLLTESDPYLFQFMTRMLDRFNPPPLVLLVISKRFDTLFLSALFKSIKEPLPMEMISNLKKIPPIEWMEQISGVFDQFDGEALQGFVLFLKYLPLSDNELESYLLTIFYHGQGEGRAAAFDALKTYSGEKIDKIVWEAAGDDDPDVQIQALTELNSRNIPGVGSRIIQFSGSSDERVRETIQKLMPNFKFLWFIEKFDQLPDDKRKKMFEVVRNLDKQTAIKLTMMLEAGDEIAVERALMCLDYCPDLIPKVENAVCYLLENDAQAVLRQRAAALLVSGETDKSRAALVQTFHRDTSAEVRQAAKTALENRLMNPAKHIRNP